MKISDYVIDFLIKNGVSDAFGIPGEVVLDFIYSADRRKNEIALHLNFHEQGSSLAAVGFSQATGKPCVSYSTKGPGMTNMLTAMADAYYDSVSVIFITAHSKRFEPLPLRSAAIQEFDTVALAKQFTKCSERIETVDELREKLPLLFEKAMSGRPGPVFLDFLSGIFAEEAELPHSFQATATTTTSDNTDRIITGITDRISKAQKPIILIGDGIRQSNTIPFLREFANNTKIPILSSRFSQDILADSRFYCGYIGSHGLRYSNYILSETDLIISLGNRLDFNRNSTTFGKIPEQSRCVRIDCDDNELSNTIVNCESYCADLRVLMPLFAKCNIYYDKANWLSYCESVKEILFASDVNFPVDAIAALLKCISPESVITSDVGNNELWLSMAYVYSRIKNRVLYSKSFGVLGCSLPKAIGAYYASKHPVICFTGDQGLMFNIQELQHLSAEKIPIIIVLLNNRSSGMIKDRQARKHLHYLHTTPQSGYSFPDFSRLVGAYGLSYYQYDSSCDYSDVLHGKYGAALIEINVGEADGTFPFLPAGNNCYDFVPALSKEIYKKLKEIKVCYDERV